MAIQTTDSIKRTVSIPFISGGKKILALTEVGGKIFSKEYIYGLFFTHGYDGVEKLVIETTINKGGTKEDYFTRLNEAHEALGSKYGITGKATGKSKRSKKIIKVKKSSNL